MAVTAERMVRERMHPAAWGCILYILVAVGRLPELLPVLAPFHVGKLAVALALVGILIGPPAMGRGVWSTPMGRLLLALSVFAILSVPFSVWRSNSLEFLLSSFVSNIIVFYVVVRTATTRRMILFYLAALLSAAALLAGMALLSGGTGRITVSTSYDPNDLALVLVTLLPVAVAGVFALRGPFRFGLLALVAAMLLVTLLTGSRGGFLGLLAVTGYLLLARFPTARGGLTRRFNLVKLAIIGAGALLLAVTVPPATWERMATMGNVEEDYNLTEDDGRIAIWQRGIEAIGQRPLGHGLAAFEAVEGQHGGRYKAAHNSWIEIGVELGIPGALLLAGLYLMGLRHLRELRILGQARLRTSGRPDPSAILHATVAVGVRGSLLGFLVTSFFLSAAYNTLLFALFGIIAACWVHARRAGAEPPPASVSPTSRARRIAKPVTVEPMPADDPGSAPASAAAAGPRLRPRTPDVRRYWQ